MKKKTFLKIKFNIVDKGQGELQYSSNPEEIFKKIIKRPLLKVSHYSSEYFSSPGDFLEKIDTQNNSMICGKIGKTHSRTLKKIVFNIDSEKFMEKDVLLEDNEENAVFTNFYYYVKSQYLIIEISSQIPENAIIKFFNHALEKHIGGNFQAKYALEEDIEYILDNALVKQISIRIERPNPINPDNIQVIKDLFKETSSEQISLKFNCREGGRLVIKENSIIESSINLSLGGYGVLNLDYEDSSGDIKKFNSKDAISKFTFDNVPESLEETAEWILDNKLILDI